MSPMYKFKRSQILLSILLASLLIVTPLLSSSLRPTYLYFILNLLIIALGAESGLLSSLLSNPNPGPSPIPSPDVKKPYVNVAPSSPPNNGIIIQGHDAVIANKDGDGILITQDHIKKPNKAVEKCNSEKIGSGISGGLKVIARVKRCPSTPSIFFIGGGETVQPPEPTREETKGDHPNQLEEEVEDINGQELFTKAETFIGNFYKQLKMQREDSWKKIHGLYQKAF